VHDPFRSVNILVVRFSSIGDIILTTPLLRAIRQRHPGSRVTVLTKEAFAPLLSDNPHVNVVLGLDTRRSLARAATELRAERYTHLLDLHGSLRSWALRALVPGHWRGYSKHRLARSVLIRTKRNIYPTSRPVAERYFAAARDLDVSPDGNPPQLFLNQKARTAATAWMGRVRIGTDRPLLAVAPGAAHATKRWPPEHWRGLIGQLVGEGFDIAVVGGEQDAPLAAGLVDISPTRVASGAGKFGLQETGAVLEVARALVSGDTGVMHMATGVGTPVVAVFGPTVEPFGFFPYSKTASVLELPLPCRPCSSQGSARCPLGHHRCLRDLLPDSVHAAVRLSIR
jgi:lipopolysaccharide heptosyltransferase II